MTEKQFPECGNNCNKLAYFGVCECENICPNKFKKYVVFEGLKLGNRFYSLNDTNEKEIDKVKLSNGKIAYRILGYADTSAQALKIIYKAY